MTIKAFIFDWFGVCTERWIDTVYRHLPEGIDFENLKKAFLKYSDDVLRGKVTGKDFMESLCKYLNLDPKKYEHLIFKHGEINQDLLDMILKLRKKYKVILITDITEDLYKAMIKETGDLSKYFDFIILSYEVGMVKIDKGIFRIALDKFSLKPEECIFIDDRERNVKAAWELGINVILFQNNEQFIKDLEDFSIRVD